ncbi:acetylcholinesterase [Fusarium albosuccineum]|uniref:Carboxylic ester hydrolase n=1 Tax=Fusarium albosuccineum TaxID=1237068 RepID=A0A8H4KWN1_9HYPO|nr:acetylcholinesterase [Fusarium albosuccineum]
MQVPIWKLCCWLLPLAGLASCNPQGKKPSAKVQIDKGTILGFIDPSAPNVRQFLGIPYGKPPVGSRRFAPPEPVAPYKGVIKATEIPQSCQQRLGSSPSVYNREILEFNLGGLNRTGRVGEDCLTLSVWAPMEVKRPVPVIVYIYGGGFSTGGQDVPYQIPTQWIQRTPELIVVSFNYRVNIFGFPGAAGLKRQNVGILDQRLAVEWVRDNIAAFGGDPDKISLWGQSAGAASVSYFSYAWTEDPIVKGYIMDSPYTGAVTTSPLNTTGFTTVAKSIGCGGLSPTKELECVRSKDADQVEDAIAATGQSFGPTADDIVVFENYTQRALQGKMAKGPAIIGTNSEDGVPFIPYGSGGDEEASTQIMLSLFFCASWTMTKNRLAAGESTYRFEYHGNFSNISPSPWLGAYHSAELPLVFGTHSLYRGVSTSFENATSRVMQESWLSFARKLNPGWPAGKTEVNYPVQHFAQNWQTARLGNTKEFEERCKNLE